MTQPTTGEQEARSLREIVTPPRTTCPNGCKERDGRTPRHMRAVVGQSTRVRKLPGGETKQVTVAVTVRDCDRCGHSQRTEEEI